MTEKKKVNIRQLSKIMQISQVTLRDWVLKGMPCEHTAKGYLVNPDEAFAWREKYLAEKKQSGSEYERARTERMLWLARQSQLNYEKESGKLVDAKDVKDAAFSKARLVRDSLLCIPARVSPLLAAETNAKKINEILTQEIRQCLENLSNNLNPESVKDDKKTV